MCTRGRKKDRETPHKTFKACSVFYNPSTIDLIDPWATAAGYWVSNSHHLLGVLQLKMDVVAITM
jgi:hypothetical protein